MHACNVWSQGYGQYCDTVRYLMCQPSLQSVCTAVYMHEVHMCTCRQMAEAGCTMQTGFTPLQHMYMKPTATRYYDSCAIYTSCLLARQLPAYDSIQAWNIMWFCCNQRRWWHYLATVGINYIHYRNARQSHSSRFPI